LLILGLLLILIAAVIAGVLIYGYLDAQHRYREIATVSGLEVPMVGDVVDPNLDLASLVFDWDALRAANADIVAWVIIPGTRVNYPIVQGPNNDYYLTHLFDSSSSGSGTIFLDSDGKASFTDRNNIIYGHNMLDGSMFSDVTLFAAQDYFNEHTTVFLCSPRVNYELRPLATLKMSQNTGLRKFEFYSDADFRSYAYDMISYAVSAVDDLSSRKPNLKKLYSFVTCDTMDFSIRIVLTCEEVRSVEPLNVPAWAMQDSKATQSSEEPQETDLTQENEATQDSEAKQDSEEPQETEATQDS
jgi:sortase B